MIPAAFLFNNLCLWVWLRGIFGLILGILPQGFAHASWHAKTSSAKQKLETSQDSNLSKMRVERHNRYWLWDFWLKTLRARVLAKTALDFLSASFCSPMACLRRIFASRFSLSNWRTFLQSAMHSLKFFKPISAWAELQRWSLSFTLGPKGLQPP